VVAQGKRLQWWRKGKGSSGGARKKRCSEDVRENVSMVAQGKRFQWWRKGNCFSGGAREKVPVVAQGKNAAVMT